MKRIETRVLKQKGDHDFYSTKLTKEFRNMNMKNSSYACCISEITKKKNKIITNKYKFYYLTNNIQSKIKTEKN